jgi:signal transduction histidine kinase
MPESDKKDPEDPESGRHWDPVQAENAPNECAAETPLSTRAAQRARFARELRASTSQLMAMLELRLDRLQAVGDPEATRIAEECEAALAEIRRQLSSFGDGEGTTGGGQA